jgi:Domain of unknown function (DUF5666)
MRDLHAGRWMTGLAATILVAGCGGGGSSDVIAPPPPVLATSTVVVGAITGFGSIFVNGVEFDTSASTFSVDDNPGIESDLSVGQVVRISGTISDDRLTGVADDVTFDNSVEGTISSIDLTTGTIVVLGQTVVIDADTVFDDVYDNPSITGLNAGDLIEVSGFTDASDVIMASRIEPLAAGSDLEVHGTVSGLDDANRTFMIGALVVDYSAAMLEDFASGAPADGDVVEVHGTSFGPNGELVASTAHSEANDFGGVADDVQIEVEGLITRFASATDFDVTGQSVTTTAGTVFENGDAGNLAMNVKVEVEGLIASGVLTATKVNIRRENAARLEAPVQTVDAAAGTLTVFGVAVSVDTLTSFDDKSDAGLPEFALVDVNVGDFVELRGVESPADSDALVVSEFVRDDSDDDIIVQGAVDDFTAGTSLVIFGITVQADAGTEYVDAIGAALTADQFFGAIAVGTLVKVRGSDVGGAVLTAQELQLEPMD